MMMKSRALIHRPEPVLPDPHWYKDAIIYELRVRSFYDSDGDGVGDFRGLTSRLDYLQDLGVTALWLLPFYPSPLRDDGYDIADYTSVHPELGTIEDFKEFLREAHRRGLRVITELVLNHTSDQHPWFQRARRAPPGSSERDFYVWSDTADRYRDARIIFQDFEPSNWSWDPVARAYFWHRFYAHQPDLNFDSPDVPEALLQVVDFWFELGVDGMRLDAVPYLYEREGTNCENLPETHEFLRRLRAHVDARFPARMLLAEANQWPEDAAAYFGNGDECHMNFHFPLMPRMYMAIHMEDRFPILDIMAQTPQLDDSCQWALFLRNHDELTLEMVTDEERDYMYRAYAHEQAMRINLGIRRRLAPLCGSDRRTMELLNALLFSMPGTPVLYYGDEIGMGDNVFLGDRNGVRTPMQWSADRNAGFSRANPQRLVLPIVIDPEYHYESVNVEAQQNNPRSLVWWMKRMITLRKQHQAFGRGTIEFLSPANHRVLAFVREHEGETILIVANLSRFAQHVELDLWRWRGLRLRELYGQSRFPPVGEALYPLTLGGHGFYWFALERPRGAEDDLRALTYEPPTVVAHDAAALLRGAERGLLEEVLPGFLRTRRWFAGRERVVSQVRLKEAVAIGESTLLLVEVTYEDDGEETYMLPVALVGENRWLPPQALIANVKLPESECRLVDALEENRSSRALLDATLSGVSAAGREGVILAGPIDSHADTPTPDVELRNIAPEHGSAALQYGDKYLLKVFRQVEEGVSPELEIARFLDRRSLGLTPPMVGAIEYRRDREEPITLAVLQRYVPNEGTAWVQAREELRRFFERVLARDRQASAPPLPAVSATESVSLEPPAVVREEMGSYLDAADQMGRRTADLHVALAADDEDRAFSPEPYTALDLRSKYQSLRNLAGKTLRQLKDLLPQLPESAQDLARSLIEHESAIVRSFHSLLGHRLTARRIRTHGDYHLGQVLFTGKDYVIIDFEGSRDRTLSERRRKRSALVDVAGMVRSFQFAAISVLLDPSVVRDEDRAVLSPWAEHWHTWSAAAFVRAYLDATHGAPFVPAALEQVGAVLDALTVERGFLELRRDLESPSSGRAVIPMRGLSRLLKLERTPLETAR
jgi:maltose alpha-D-glucosyltransferase/alpha-amylase